MELDKTNQEAINKEIADIKESLSAIITAVEELTTRNLESAYAISSGVWSLDFLVNFLAEKGIVEDQEKFKEDHVEFIKTNSEKYYLEFLKELGVGEEEAKLTVAKMMEELTEKMKNFKKEYKG